MFTLVVAAPKSTLGYSFWNGFVDQASFRLKDVCVSSYESCEMSAFMMLIPNMPFAQKEAARINQHIAEHCAEKAEVFVLPLSVVVDQMERSARR